MANTDITSRTQFERTDLRAGGEGIRRGSEKGAAIFSAVALVVAVALCVTAVLVIESWAQWLVLGVIVMTTIGVMIALSPNRRGA
jgi:hypothetical protein